MCAHFVMINSLTDEIKKLQEEFQRNDDIMGQTHLTINTLLKESGQQYSSEVLQKVLQEYTGKNITILEKISQLQTTLSTLTARKRSYTDLQDQDKDKEQEQPNDCSTIKKSKSGKLDVIVIDDFEFRPMRYVYDKYNRVIAEYVPNSQAPYTTKYINDIQLRQARSYALTCIINDLHNEILAYIKTFTKERLNNLFETSDAIEITFSQVQERSTNTFPYTYGNPCHRVDIHLDMVFNLTNSCASREHGAWRHHFNSLGYEIKISHLKIQDQKHASITVYKQDSRKK